MTKEDYEIKLDNLNKEIDLENKSKEINSLINTNKKEIRTDLTGKYIHFNGEFLETYIYVEQMSRNDVLKADFIFGPKIDIYKTLKLSYCINNNGYLYINDNYSIINKEEFDKVLNKAIDNIKYKLNS